MDAKRIIVATLLALLVAGGCGKDDKKGGGESSGLGAKTGGIPTSREGQMYLLGQKLSQAAMVNGRAAPDVVARTFKSAATVADITLQTKLAPLPEVTGDKAKDTAAGMHYLLNEQGKELGTKISAEMGESAVATYELAVKVNMLPMLYIDDPADKMGDTMADVFARLAAKAKLPDTALGPIIAKLKARAPMKEVTDMALDLNKSLPVAIAMVYEKDDKPSDKK
jgi:hypothetical protein